MPSRQSSALSAMVVLVLQLALGLVDPACRTRMSNGEAMPQPVAQSRDAANCEELAPGHDRDEHDQAPPQRQTPASCHAFAMCGVTFLSAPDGGARDSARADIEERFAEPPSLSSISNPPDRPPPRA